MKSIRSWISPPFIAATLLTSFLGAAMYHPALLHPIVQLGVPLYLAEKLPILGQIFREATAPQITVQSLQELIKSGRTDFLLVDVRSPEEYALSHIPGAISVPITEIESGSGIETIRQALQGRWLITYCAVGPRSHSALTQLKKAGIRGTNVTGGLTAWQHDIDPTLPIF
jgi:adenylyltransferase/sulfurtransferase